MPPRMSNRARDGVNNLLDRFTADTRAASYFVDAKKYPDPGCARLDDGINIIHRGTRMRQHRQRQPDLHDLPDAPHLKMRDCRVAALDLVNPKERKRASNIY
jgi:hypothetical protein